MKEVTETPIPQKLSSSQKKRRNNAAVISVVVVTTQLINFFIVPLLLVFFFSGSTVVVDAIPPTLTIKHNQKECVLEYLSAGEYLTMSVFIISGRELKGTVTIDGPVSLANPPNVPTKDKEGESRGIAGPAQRMYNDISAFDHGMSHTNRGREGGDIRYKQTLNFETLAEETDNLDFDDWYVKQGEDDDARLYHEFVGDDGTVDAETKRKREEQYEREKMKLKAKNERKKNKEEEQKRKKGSIRRNGEPWQRTIQASQAGWYRSCVVASWYQITAEVELRKSSELGPPDESTGHVMTHEQRALLDMQKYQVEDAAEESDLEKAKSQLKELQELMEQIRRKQSIERHELALHSAVNEHSHSRMVMNSLFETVLFIAASGFQVYSVRKWFEGAAPMLGR